LAILNADHLLDQAEKLIVPPPAGPPRQVDLRRAISSAYYAVFHAVLKAAADLYVGATNRADYRYVLVYRSVDHRDLRDLCAKVKESNFSGKLAQYVPLSVFDEETRTFSKLLLELQGRRLDADYNPAIRLRTAGAQLAITIARDAINRLRNAQPSSREAFLTLLLFKVR
jgi:uncharacterized protein (UPF0332 family)